MHYLGITYSIQLPVYNRGISDSAPATVTITDPNGGQILKTVTKSETIRTIHFRDELDS